MTSPSTMHMLTSWRSLISAFVGFLYAALAEADNSTITSIPRHPLELRALLEPNWVLKELPENLARAQQRQDLQEVALLYLAQANACRVIADWICQRDAGASAHAAAIAAGQPVLQVRGLIAEGRGSIALQDYYRGEQLLGEAERLLKSHPLADLSGDVYLAYSTLSFDLGKHVVSLEFADRGLLALQAGGDLPMQARLLRNRARAQTQLGQVDAAKLTLIESQELAQRFSDPKLSAELFLEIARLARTTGDFATQYRYGAQVLELATTIENAQLTGQAHEVLGLAALDEGDLVRADKELHTAYLSFRRLKLWNDELRVLRSYLAFVMQHEPSKPEVAPLVRRLVELDIQIDREQRAKASADFDARLKYAEGEVAMAQLKSEAALAQEREKVLHARSRLGLSLLLVGILSSLAMWFFLLQQRRAQQRLQQSETRYRLLSDHASDLVVCMRPDGTMTYVSPSCVDMLGWQVTEFMAKGLSFVHPDDHALWATALEVLHGNGGPTTVMFRARHRNGHFLNLEALARLAPSGMDQTTDVIYTARDISAKVAAEQARNQSEKRLQLITNNLPALIAYIDQDERYSFCNAMIGKVFGVDPAAMLGRTMREMRGEAIYADIAEPVAAALAGVRVSFEGRGEAQGKEYYYQSEYVPDLNEDDSVRGFFAMTFDITRFKLAERRLRLITDNLPALISYIDASGIFRFNNSTYEQWLERPLSEITDMHLREVYDSATFDLIWPYIERALAGEKLSFELEPGDGRKRHLRVSYVPDTNEEGRILGVYGMIHDISEFKRIESELRILAQFDALTGLPNRNRYNDTLSKAIARSERSGQLLALIFLDLDRFKAINDTLGHQAGDQVLKEFAQRLLRSVRRTDTVARLAGDEFVIILEALHAPEESETVAQKIATEMLPAFEIVGQMRTISTSLGIAVRRSGELDGEALLSRADGALYSAKAAGRGGYCLAS